MDEWASEIVSERATDWAGKRLSEYVVEQVERVSNPAIESTSKRASKLVNG